MNKETIEKITEKWSSSAIYDCSFLETFADVWTLLFTINELEGELITIDELLARRDALDSEPTRYSKIQKAIHTAKCAEQAESRIKELESDLKLNASMLAKQCDLAREAETEREHISKLLIEERIKVVKLRDAINRHEKFKRTHNNIVALADEELYQTKKEIEE
jgi:hypothetical protein